MQQMDQDLSMSNLYIRMMHTRTSEYKVGQNGGEQKGTDDKRTGDFIYEGNQT